MDNTDITEKALSIIDKFNHDRDIAKQQFNHDNLVEWHNRPNRPIGAVETRQIVLRGDTSEFHMLHDDLVRSFEEYACRFSYHIAPIKYIRKKYNWDSTKPDTVLFDETDGTVKVVEVKPKHNCGYPELTRGIGQCLFYHAYDIPVYFVVPEECRETLLPILHTARVINLITYTPTGKSSVKFQHAWGSPIR